MDKKQWIDTYFADEMPDCLPLPDIREKEGTRWAKHGFAVDRGYEAAELAAGFALLLGVYGGITDAAFVVRQGDALVIEAEGADEAAAAEAMEAFLKANL